MNESEWGTRTPYMILRIHPRLPCVMKTQTGWDRQWVTAQKPPGCSRVVAGARVHPPTDPELAQEFLCWMDSNKPGHWVMSGQLRCRLLELQCVVSTQRYLQHSGVRTARSTVWAQTPSFISKKRDAARWPSWELCKPAWIFHSTVS